MIAASGVTMVAVATACAILAGLSAANPRGPAIDFGRLGVVADAVETATAGSVDFAG
jgi:hypothetical protein